MGADGFYFDCTHMPKKGFWYEYCKAKFSRLSRNRHRVDENFRNSICREVLGFTDRTIEEVLLSGARPSMNRIRNVFL